MNRRTPAVACALALLAAPGGVRAGPRELPVEAASPAELLSVTHLFVVDVAAVSARAWAAGADGLEHRRLDLGLVLGDVYKGAVVAAYGERFQAVLEQARESGGAISDDHGPWSHREIAVGDRLLIATNSQATSPTALVQGPVKAVHDATTTAADVKAARAAELRFTPGLRARSLAQQMRAARGLLAATRAGRGTLGDLYGAYFWERLRPAYAAGEAALAPLVVDLIQAAGVRAGLRQALAAGAYTAVLDLGWTPRRAQALAAPLLRLLLSGEAAPMKEWLVAAPLSNLIFPEGGQRLEAKAVIPSPTERKRIAAALQAVTSDRAARLATWLLAGKK